MNKKQQKKNMKNMQFNLKQKLKEKGDNNKDKIKINNNYRSKTLMMKFIIDCNHIFNNFLKTLKL